MSTVGWATDWDVLVLVLLDHVLGVLFDLVEVVLAATGTGAGAGAGAGAGEGGVPLLLPELRRLPEELDEEDPPLLPPLPPAPIPAVTAATAPVGV